MVITVSRQFLAGAETLAKQVADALGWTVLDDAFVERLAEKSGFTMDEVRGLEERAPSFLERFAQSSALSFPEFLVSTPMAMEEPDAVKLAHSTRELIEDIGRRERVVMVGRAAAAILARDQNALHVRLVASRAYRIGLAMHELGLDPVEAEREVDQRDAARARYHRELYGRDWNDPELYHCVLNTELLGIEGAAQMVISRARAIGWGN